MFIKLTHKYGNNPVWVNFDKVSWMYRVVGINATRIHFEDEYVEVVELPEDILDKVTE